MPLSKKARSAEQPAPEFFSGQVASARRFYLNLQPSSKAPLSIVSGGVEHCLPEYQISRSEFPFYSIEYVVRGGGSVKLKGQMYGLQPGLLFSYGPGIPHEITADVEEPPVKYFVDFLGARSKQMLKTSGLSPGRVSQVFPSHELQNLFDELIHCGRLGMADVCVKLLECIVLRIKDSRAPQETAETLSFMTYQRCRAHIEKHFLHINSLEQIARECHVDAAYLCRLFQRYDRRTPYQFLMRLKMSLAAEWLQQPGALVKQVAERSGFRDPFHFSRAFKRSLGIAPRALCRMR